VTVTATVTGTAGADIVEEEAKAGNHRLKATAEMSWLASRASQPPLASEAIAVQTEIEA
jgi:hypothetical protein